MAWARSAVRSRTEGSLECIAEEKGGGSSLRALRHREDRLARGLGPVLGRAVAQRAVGAGAGDHRNQEARSGGGEMGKLVHAGHLEAAAEAEGDETGEELPEAAVAAQVVLY